MSGVCRVHVRCMYQMCVSGTCVRCVSGVHVRYVSQAYMPARCTCQVCVRCAVSCMSAVCQVLVSGEHVRCVSGVCVSRVCQVCVAGAALGSQRSPELCGTLCRVYIFLPPSEKILVQPHNSETI